MMLQRKAIRQASGKKRGRPGVAAVEFALVAGLLFTIFLGMIEMGRAMMALGAVSNAARCGARAGALSGGNYTAVSSAVGGSLDAAGLPSSPSPITVTVNGTVVTDDTSFTAAATPGCPVVVQVQVSYRSVSWFPAGSSFFLPSNQQLTETVVMRREG